MMTFFRTLTLAAVLLYGAAGFFGWEFGSAEKEPIPPSARNSPGGYRSISFWHVGLHGGK